MDTKNSSKEDPLLPSYTTATSDDGRPPSDATPSDTATPQPSRFGHRFHRVSSSIGRPLNKAANIIGAEGWWPSTMHRECSKAARILYSFTKLQNMPLPTAAAPLHPTGLTKKSIVTIPDEILRNCAGLAIFNVLRVGHMNGSLAGGSGVVVARRADGSWSPPSAFVVSTLGAGFVFGIDLYECVCVLTTPQQVAAFTRPRVSLGGDASVAVGPVGSGAAVSAALSASARPVWSYIKSRGVWAGVQIQGTVMLSRADANAALYNQRGISAKTILTGDVAWPEDAKPLFEVLRELEATRRMAPVGDDGEKGQSGTEGQDGAEAGRVEVSVEKTDAKEEVEVHYESVLEEKERLRKSGF
ncbi:hypothetical protein VHEMI09945 [[Torrubiella] hemipterigena]|uniref:Ysc84 actin-binding domain-containing protein n=1 Tax=[Torrubiella] hemipterigena TaxID=1531966 RepID=A0A0A1TSE9_9HYPO|nr:hypothetical protein VHEMI09945 [[Torrubiella] hemipterigena]